jgi:nucleoside-diphosphate-sugar epimerase
MRVAVTGASGFIGRHVMTRFAARGDQPTAVSRPFARASLAEALSSADVVIHLAGVVAATDDRTYIDGNVTATRVVAEAARDAGVPMIHVSSLAAAGPASAAAPRAEDDPPSPITTYGRTKLQGEQAVKATEGLRWTVLRPGVVYGPGDRALVPLFRMARTGVLPIVGRNDAAYTFVYIDDLVDAIVAAADRLPISSTIFVGHPQPVTPGALVSQVREATGGRASIVRVPQPVLRLAALAGDLAGAVRGRPVLINSRRFVELDSIGFVCRVDRLREDLGVEPMVALADGLRHAAGWYLSQA